MDFSQNGPLSSPNGRISKFYVRLVPCKSTESLTIWGRSPRFPVLVCSHALLCTDVHNNTHLHEGLQTSISDSNRDDFVERLEPILIRGMNRFAL